MRIARSLVAVASSLLWPTVVVAIPVGITFSAARVYAESGVAPPPSCSGSTATICAGRDDMQACDCGKGIDCACTESSCSTNSGVSTALMCQPVASCRRLSVAPCEGKAVGEACTQTDTLGAPGPSGTCEEISGGCLAENDAGFFVPTFPLACNAPVGAGSSGGTSGATPSEGSSATAPEASSGCSMTSRDAGTSLLFALPVGLGLAFAYRRKRRS